MASQVWDSAYEAIPDDDDEVGEGALRIRNTRIDVRERAAFEHIWEDPADVDDLGKHRQVTFVDPLGAAPTPKVDEGTLYTKDVAGKAELFWQDEDGNEIQVTREGTVESLLLTTTRTVEIGATGDYANWQDALDGEMKWRPASQDVAIFLKFQTGETITDRLSVSHGDYSHMRIVSFDAVVNLDLAFPAATNVINGNYAMMPVLDTLIDGNGTDGLHGYRCVQNSHGRITAGNGVINLGEATGVGLYVDTGSTVQAPGADFSGNPIGCWVLNGSALAAEGLIFSGCTESGIKIDGASKAHLLDAVGTGVDPSVSNFVMRVSGGSIVDATSIDLSGCLSGDAVSVSGGASVNLTGADLSSSFGRAINARRCFISAFNINADGCGGDAVSALHGAEIQVTGTLDNAGGHGIHSQGGKIFCNGVGILNPTDNAINATEGSVISAKDFVTTTPVVGVFADGASTVEADGASITSASSHGVHATGASTVDIQNGTVVSAGADGIFADEVSTINANGASITLSTSSGAEAFGGSHINVIGATVGSSGVDDLRVQKGSYMAADDCVTSNSPPNPDIVDCSVVSFNALEGSQGIIWQTT